MSDPNDNIVETKEEEITSTVNLDKNALSGSHIDVEIVDDTPEPDRGRPRRQEGAQPDIPEEDEIKKYSADVQKRLNKIKWEFHEERRAKEEAIRQAEEAARFARTIMEQNRSLQNTVRGGEKVLVDQARGRVDAELGAAKAAYKKAYEEGNTEELIKAQEKIAELKVQADKVANYQPTQFEAQPEFKATQTPKVDPLFSEWKSKNDKWFQRDDEMTSFAMGVHKKLVDSGVDPRSRDYYERIDRRMREVFPSAFSSEGASSQPARVRSSGNVVAPAVRSSNSSGGNQPRTVQLTATQASLAKRLGITPQQYAAQLIKEGQ
jgi:hypothetical protein